MWRLRRNYDLAYQTQNFGRFATTPAEKQKDGNRSTYSYSQVLAVVREGDVRNGVTREPVGVRVQILQRHSVTDLQHAVCEAHGLNDIEQ